MFLTPDDDTNEPKDPGQNEKSKTPEINVDGFCFGADAWKNPELLKGLDFGEISNQVEWLNKTSPVMGESAILMPCLIFTTMAAMIFSKNKDNHGIATATWTSVQIAKKLAGDDRELALEMLETTTKKAAGVLDMLAKKIREDKKYGKSSGPDNNIEAMLREVFGGN